jgi:PHP family Zn ribbon phosphoesterase
MNVRHFVIARIKNLQLLNGSEVRPRERKDSEKYYLQQCTKELLSQKQQSPDFDKQHPRYKELVKQYGDYSELLKKTNSDQLSGFASMYAEIIILTRLAVTVKHFAISGMDKNFKNPENAITKKRLQTSMTIRMLKQMFERMWKIPSSKQQLYYLAKVSTLIKLFLII